MIKTTTSPQWTGFITSFMNKTKMAAANTPALASAKKFPHGPFQFETKLPSGSAYEIQASSDMQKWVSVTSGTAQEDSVEYLDADAAKLSFRFYRARCGGFFSKNITGYVTSTLPPGFSMICNPLHATSNTVASLLSDLPEGATLCKFDTSLFRLTNNTMKDGAWSSPNDRLLPGEGAIFFNPSSEFQTIDFVGDVRQGRLLNPIPSGMSICSSLVPQAGRLNSDLGFPIADGDVIHLFDRDQQKYVLYPFSAVEWEHNPPAIGVGESFWINKTQPGNWVREFAVT